MLNFIYKFGGLILQRILDEKGETLLAGCLKNSPNKYRIQKVQQQTV